MVKFSFIIFGATGDLARKKLIPALHTLHKKEIIKGIPIICIGRRVISQEDYFNLLDVKDNNFLKLIYYKSVNVKDNAKDLGLFVKELEKKHLCNGRIFYLSIASYLYKEAVDVLKNADLLNIKDRRIAFEKPFGENLKDAKELNEYISKIFKEEEVYRIDHYLGKELVDNILVFRFANSIFENVWNKEFVDHVQISLSEAIGVEERGESYETYGAIKDMVQNHILQVLSLVAMELPKSIKAEHIRDEKVKVLKALEKVKEENVVIGQYDNGLVNDKEVLAYRKEKNVNINSNVETYVAFKAFINNNRWRNVPFYIRTGKRLDRKYSEINLVMKNITYDLFRGEGEVEKPNIISIRINPEDGIAVRFNARSSVKRNELREVAMEYSHKSEFGADTLEAYEVLFREIVNGDQTLFTRWDEVEESWKVTEQILKISEKKRKDFPNYKAGSSGPKEAEELIKRDKRSWIFFERKFKV